MSYSKTFLAVLAAAGHIEYPTNGSEDEALALYTHLGHFAEAARTSTETLRSYLFKADREHLEKTLMLTKIELQGCRALKLVSDCEHILRYIVVRGIGSSTVHIEKFISDLIAFSIAIQLAQHQKTHTPEVTPQKPEVLTCKTLLAQLQQALEEYDEEKSLKCIAKLEPFGLATHLEPIKRLAASFEFDKAIGVLTALKASSTEDTTVKKRVVLAVDDMPQNLAMLKAILGERCKFVGVTSGVAALKYLETNIPDVYILDIDMPNMNGFELVDAIRAKRKIAPFIFLTANATKEYVMQALSMGITDFLVKPCNEDAVFAKLDAIFAARSF